MAFRIADSVVKGELDNRIKGIIRGKIWLFDRPEPLVLELTGNAWPDLAGCLLTFANVQKPLPHPGLGTINLIQSGAAGDITASRKVRAFDAPRDAASEMLQRRERPPERIANCLYVEWFSRANGRVVIESTDYTLTISAPEWRMTPQEERERSTEATEAMQAFLRQLDRTIDLRRQGLKDYEEQWDEHDYEKFLKERDASNDKYGELIDKYGLGEEAQGIIAREMGWTDEEDARAGLSVEGFNALCEEAAGAPEVEPNPQREGVDWVRTGFGIAHPLQHRCSESSLRFHDRVEELGLKPNENPSLERFVFQLQVAAAKLAGALTPIARGEYQPDPGFTVACLKRALSHLHESQAGLSDLARQNILPNDLLTEARQELFEIREGILRLMDGFRGRSGTP